MSGDDVSGEVASDEVAELKRDLDDKLFGDDSRTWRVAFRRFLARQNPWEEIAEEEVDPGVDSSFAKKPFPVWKTIRIGGMFGNELDSDLRKKRVNVPLWAELMMSNEQFITLPEPRRICLALVTMSDLDFTTGQSLEKVLKRSLELGLAPCPPEAGPHLRRAHIDLSGAYWMVMEPIGLKNKGPHIFRVDFDCNHPRLDGVHMQNFSTNLPRRIPINAKLVLMIPDA